MNELKPYICPQCGGKVNRATLICEMCGTQFHEVAPNGIIIARPGVHVLGVNRVINDEMFYLHNPQELSEYILKDMAREFASCILPFLDVRSEQNPCRNQTILSARLRVVEPTFRF